MFKVVNYRKIHFVVSPGLIIIHRRIHAGAVLQDNFPILFKKLIR